MKTHRPARGFVLLIVLMVLAICSTVLAMAIRRSADKAILANQALRDLQVRWGNITAREAILPVAEKIIQEQEKAEGVPLVEVRREIVLGGLRFQFVLGDEQAKANVNLLARQGGLGGLSNSLRRLQLDQRRMIEVRLKPIDGAVLRDEAARAQRQAEIAMNDFIRTGRMPRGIDPRLLTGLAGIEGGPGQNLASGPGLVAPPPGSGSPMANPAGAAAPGVGGAKREAEKPLLELFRSYDQVFNVRHASQLVGLEPRDGSVVRLRVTCWGDGKINFRRASREVLREVLAGVLTETQLSQLEELRRDKPELTMQQAFSLLQLSAEAQQEAAPLVSGGSQTYSLWVLAEEMTRLHYFLHVQEGVALGRLAELESELGGVTLEDLGPLTPEQEKMLRDAGVLRDSPRSRRGSRRSDPVDEALRQALEAANRAAGQPGQPGGPMPDARDAGIGDPELGALQPGQTPPGQQDDPLSEMEFIRRWSFLW